MDYVDESPSVSKNYGATDRSFDPIKSSLVLRSTYIPYVKYILLLNCFVSFVFYGFNATLSEYFQSEMNLSEAWAGFLTNMFISLNYVFSLVGGFIADEYWGKLRTINISVWTFTLALLVITVFSALSLLYSTLIYGVFFGLFIVTIGNGMIIPCISSLIGDQFLPHQEVERSTYYSWYYLLTQVGSIASTFLTPFIIEYSPTLLYLIFLFILFGTAFPFTCFQSKYRKVPPVQGVYKIVIGVILYGIFGIPNPNDSNEHWLDKSKKKYSDRDVEDVKVVLRVLQVFVPMPFFWAIYFQIFSLWVFMAEGMNTEIWGYSIPPGSITSLNPLIDLFLIPITAKLIYPLFTKIGYPLRPLQKMAAGLYFTVVALLVASLIQLLNHYYYLSVLWMIPQFFFISCAEITLSITAIEFAYTQAPKRMKSAMTAVWFFTVAIGNILVAVIALIDLEQVALELLIFAAVIFMISGIFVGIAIQYRYHSPNPLVGTPENSIDYSSDMDSIIIND